ncbi:hypothetical protein EV363DRAFT_1566582 [Boletus edulis]|nr:hypothetical protein EV363DRAFT_1566582 [Boletus edulis]
MPDARLPEYAPPPSQLLSPTYTATPRAHEYRLALNPRLRPNRPLRSFVKQTKSGNVSLRLIDQDDQVALPVYCLGASVQGTAEINKTEGVTSVEVQVEGILESEEVGEGGTSTHRLFSNKSMLWIKNRVQDAPCPNKLRFRFPLPTTYSDGGHTYLLPPSFEARLSGIPGFRAHVSYSVSVVVIKPSAVSNMVKSTLFRKDDWTVSTPFLYLPRTRPSVPIPAPLGVSASSGGFAETPQWKLFSSITTANRQGIRDLATKLYIPTTRMFCIRQPIPFHLSFHSDTDSLRAFLPLAPVAGRIAPKRQATQIQLMRQTTVDVHNAIVFGAKSDIWRVDCIGEAAFRNAGNGADWAAFSGDIFISDEVTVGGFRANGTILVLTTTPPDLSKSPFKELRMTVPIRLATDPWNNDGTGIGAYDTLFMSSSEELAAVPEPSRTS